MQFFSEIGFGFPTEKKLDVWEDEIVERRYRGEIRQNMQNMSTGGSVLPERTFTTVVNVVADPFALENYTAIRYVRWAGSLWTVTSVQFELRPRLILTLGEKYNGPTAPAQ